MNTSNQEDSKTLPPIGQLFRESWSTFTQSVLSLFVLSVVEIAIFIALAVIAVLIFILSGIGSALLKDGLSGIMTNLSSGSTIITAAVIAVILGIIGTIIGSALQIGSILLVDSQGRISIGTAIKKSLGFIIPLFIVNILIFLLTFGSLFVLILPAILFYFLLIFTQFEVVLNNQRWTGAVKRSVTLVSKNFGAILVRVIILALIYLIYSILTSLLSKTGDDTALFVSIISIIINLLLGWFTLAYLITLYKQTNKGNEDGKGIIWMYILALIGWIIAAALIFGSWKFLSSGLFKNLVKQSDKSVGTSIQRSINEGEPKHP